MQNHSTIRKDSNVTANSSFIKLPNIEISPEFKNVKDKKKEWNISSTLPTLCLNRGWMNPLKTSTSENSRDFTRFGDN